MNKILSLLVIILFVQAANVKAQEAWTLEKCITYALDNNITIKRQEVNNQLQQTKLDQSKLNRLPDLNGRTSYGLSYGYTWVQQAAQNIEVNNSSFSLGVGSSVDVFNGFNLSNKIKQNQIDLMATMALAEEIKNDISLRITSQYLQILFDKELLAIAEEQYEVTNQQVERSKKLVDAGSQAKGSYLEIKSQAAKEALNVTTQKNNLGLSLLNLAQLLDLEYVAEFDVISPVIPEVNEINLAKPVDVYKMAIDIMPEIKGANYNLQSSEVEVDIAKSGYYPRLSIDGSWGANAIWLEDDPDKINRPLGDQINSTKNLYIGATLNVPIFNKLQTRNSVKNARVRVIDANYALSQAKLTLRKEIQQAYADALAAHNKYISSNEAVESFKESFRYTEEKFNVGLVNSVDYNVAKTDFTRAQSNLIQSKYEYILRNKILDFYKGVPIQL